jgi:hypothetical protein
VSAIDLVVSGWWLGVGAVLQPPLRSRLCASFFTYTGPGRVSIARWAPRDTPAGFRIFKPLAPGDWSRTHRHWVDEATFASSYAQQLAS